MKLTYPEINSLLNVVHKDHTRYAMNAANVTESYIEATDGKCCVRITPTDDRKFTPALLPRKLLESVKSSAPRKKADRASGVDVTVTGEELTFKCGSATIEGKQAEGTYPPIDNVLPDTPTDAVEVSLGLGVLLPMLKAFKDNGVDTVTFMVDPTPGVYGIGLRLIARADDVDMFGVIMPVNELRLTGEAP